jgi:hypothetical protein
MKKLTVNLAKTLIGKTIKWQAPIYENNEGFYGMGLDGGVMVIEYVDDEKRMPLKIKTIEGTSGEYIFNEWGAGKELSSPLCFSDADRWVSFIEIK